MSVPSLAVLWLACMTLFACARPQTHVTPVSLAEEATAPNDVQPTEGDQLTIQVHSLDTKSVQIRDPLGNLDTDTVHNIPNSTRSYGQEFGGPRRQDYGTYLAVSIESPPSGIYEVEVITDVPNGFRLSVTGWSWNAGCDAAIGDYAPVSPGHYIWTVNFQRDISGRCHIDAR